MAKIAPWECHQIAFRVPASKNTGRTLFSSEKEQRKQKEASQVPPRFELGSLDSESRVLTVTPRNHLCQLAGSFHLSLIFLSITKTACLVALADKYGYASPSEIHSCFSFIKGTALCI